LVEGQAGGVDDDAQPIRIEDGAFRALLAHIICSVFSTVRVSLGCLGLDALVAGIEFVAVVAGLADKVGGVEIFAAGVGLLAIAISVEKVSG
jgi:hypothetical protein